MQIAVPLSLQTRAFVYRQGMIISVALGALVLFASLWVIWLTLTGLATVGNIIYSEQAYQLMQLQRKLKFHEEKETEYILQTEQLRRALHDIRSPMSALGLRIHILKRHVDEQEREHLNQMKLSLDNAIAQVQTISDIQHGKVAPTDTLQIKVKDIQRAQAALLAK